MYIYVYVHICHIIGERESIASHICWAGLHLRAFMACSSSIRRLANMAINLHNTGPGRVGIVCSDNLIASLLFRAGTGGGGGDDRGVGGDVSVALLWLGMSVTTCVVHNCCIVSACNAFQCLECLIAYVSVIHIHRAYA